MTAPITDAELIARLQRDLTDDELLLLAKRVYGGRVGSIGFMTGEAMVWDQEGTELLSIEHYLPRKALYAALVAKLVMGEETRDD